MHASAIMIFVAVFMVTFVTAQTSSIVNLYLGGFADGVEDQTPPLVGSIVASDTTATTYSITCGSTTTAAATSSSISDFDDDCGFPASFTITQGPSTVQYAVVYTDDPEYDNTMTGSASDSSLQPDQATYVIGCVISGSSSAYCSATDIELVGTAIHSSADTTMITGTDFAKRFSAIPVTITAGPTSTSGSATKTTSGASITGSASGSGSSNSSATASSSSASGSTTSTGGMPMITAKAQWVVGGAAAAAMIAAL